MMYFTFFCTISLVIYFFFVLRSEKKERVGRRLSMFVHQEEAAPGIEETQEKTLIQRIFFPLWLEFKRSFKRKIPGEKEAKIELKLMQAGNPFGMTPVEYRLLQIALFLLCPFLFGAYGFLIQLSTAGSILLGICGIGVALFLPRFYIKQKIKTRNYHAIRELPDILDLLTVSLEAGLGFDSAISKVVSKKEGVLADEFHRCLEEIRLGKTRREALAGIRDRIVSDEIKVLISSIIQAERLGIGMVTVLRIQSNEVRDQRKQRAEEEAMKAPIKMLFPLVLFIFPSVFIVLLGPAMIQFLMTFNK